MKSYILFGAGALVIALLLITNRTMLAGNTVTGSEISITARNEPMEQRIFFAGGILGGLGLIAILVGVIKVRQGAPRYPR